MRRLFERIEYTRIVLTVSWTIAIVLGLGLLFASSGPLERSVLLSETVRDASPLNASVALERHADVRSFLIGTSETIDGASEREISHMHDVRRVFEILSGVALVFIAIGVGALRKRSDLWTRRIVRDVSIGVAGIVIVVGAIGVVGGFSDLFTTFHLILFPQGNWTFPADSYLITLYPEVFFARMAAAIGTLTLLCALITYLIARP